MGYALLFYQALIGINVPNDQAAAVVQALEQSMSSELATKADLALTKSELKAEMAELRNDMIALEQRLTLRMGAMMVAISGLLFAALKLT